MTLFFKVFYFLSLMKYLKTVQTICANNRAIRMERLSHEQIYQQIIADFSSNYAKKCKNVRES